MNSPAEPSEEHINQLVAENHGWTEAIARSVARAWNMDWQMDGLDGAAMEALLFCARRFDKARGVPFRAYARKRIHEASTDAARKTKNWHRGLPGSSTAKSEQQSREISADLLNAFPELRMGELPGSGEDGEDFDTRGSIRQLLMGASLFAASNVEEGHSFEEMLDAKRMVEVMAILELVHQVMLWKIYWEGFSMRGVADLWEIDELNVIREHKALLTFLYKSISKGKHSQPPKIRPGLKAAGLKLLKSNTKPPFSQLLNGKSPMA